MTIKWKIMIFFTTLIILSNNFLVMGDTPTFIILDEDQTFTIFVDNNDADTRKQTVTIEISNEEPKEIEGELIYDLHVISQYPNDIDVVVKATDLECLTRECAITFPQNEIVPVEFQIEIPEGISYLKAMLVVRVVSDVIPKDSKDSTPIATTLLAYYPTLTVFPDLELVELFFKTSVIAVLILIIMAIDLAWELRFVGKLGAKLGEVEWDKGGSIAPLTALVSGAGVIALMGNSAGIDLSTFSISEYAIPMAIAVVLFVSFSLLAAPIYKISGYSKTEENDNNLDFMLEGGRVWGYLISASFIFWTLIGSILLSATLIKVIVLREVEPFSPYYLGTIDNVVVVISIIIALLYVTTVLGDIRRLVAEQEKANKQEANKDPDRTEKEQGWVDIAHKLWKNNDGKAEIAMAFAQLPDHIKVPLPDHMKAPQPPKNMPED